MEGLENSSVKDAIILLNKSRDGTNERLAEKNSELVRKSPTEVAVIDTKTGIEQIFEIETIENGNDKRFHKTYEFLGTVFNEDELGPEDTLAEQMDGLRYGNTMETNAKAVTFNLSLNQEVVATLIGSVIDLQDEQGKFTGESIFMVFYAASKKDEKDETKSFRRYGFSRELMISAYEYAERKAKERKRKLIAAVGECTYTSRTFWERVGWKRCYVQPKDDKSKNWKEIKYIQPPLAFDLETGEPETGDAPEHFMAKLFNQGAEQDPKLGRKLVSIVRGFYRTNNYIPRKTFGLALNEQTGELESDNPNTDPGVVEKAIKAYRKHEESMTPHLEEFAQQFEGMKVRFLTEAEIKAEELIVKDYITPAEAEDNTQQDSHNDTL